MSQVPRIDINLARKYNPWIDFVYCCKRIFNQPSMATIGGEWKSGKTDLGLMIAVDILKRYGVVSEVGSNIRCEKNGVKDDRVTYVASLQKLKYWLHRDRLRKCYIFDEAIKHAYKRTPMAKTQVGLIQVITELSKGHGRGIIISQDPTMVDKDLLNPIFCRALFVKGGFERRDRVELYSSMIEGGYRDFRGIPRTSVKFDPYLEADFGDEETEPLMKNRDLQIFHRYIFQKETFRGIAGDLNIDKDSVKGAVTRVGKLLWMMSIPKAEEVMKALTTPTKEPS